jgi:uncharacterized protein (DUF4415 family)
MREKHIVVRARARGRGRTDWQGLASMKENEIARRAKTDPDAQPTDADFWREARVVEPPGKHPVTLRVDNDVLEWFKAHGRRYQSRMNAVLRSYMEAHRKTG